MGGHYEHLGAFSDWVAEAKRQRPLYPAAPPGDGTRQRVRDVLGFSDDRGVHEDVKVEASWERDGLVGEEVSWSVGYGPRPRGWVLKPVDVREPLPAVLALHGHDGFKFFGKEKVADGLGDLPPSLVEMRNELYEGRAFANSLAKRGFVVLAHDAFLWGSRRFPLREMPDSIKSVVEDYRLAREQSGNDPDEVELYNVAARHHENLIAKYCALLGTTLAGVVAREDRAAVGYLRSRPDVLSDRIGCVGLSGGGCRAALLQATCEHVRAAVVVGMMTTYEDLLDRYVDQHTWMFFPPALARLCDWPDLAACRAPSPLMVQFNRGDYLFSMKGMLKADRRIGSHYRSAGRAQAYRGEFYDGSHKFDVRMQEAAFDWLEGQLV
jgi:dienelactone hydrolase